MLKASLKRYFLTGLLVITPIWGTFLILKTLFLTVDSILGDLLAQMVPDHYVPGLGILTLILLVFMTGLFAANFMGKQIVKLWEGWLNRVPLVRGIYSTLKSMMDILSFSEAGSYHRVVLIQFPKNGHYCFAFVTGVTKGDMQDLAQEPLVHVYVPTSPNPTSGYFLLVPGARGDRGQYQCGRSNEVDCVGRTVFAYAATRIGFGHGCQMGVQSSNRTQECRLDDRRKAHDSVKTT